MLFGDKATFAIECYHDTFPNDHRWVFGRMCLWLGGDRLGDVDEPACALNVTEYLLEGLLQRLESLDDPALRQLGDREAFDRLDRAIYGHEAKSIEQTMADSRRFSRFDLLTAGGESFDKWKSFIIGDGASLRVLFEDEQRRFASARVDRAAFILTVRGFLEWVNDEGAKLQV